MASLPVITRKDADPEQPGGSGFAVARRKDVRVAIWPVVVVLYAILLPREFRLAIGTFEFFADRIALMLILPYVIRKLMDGAIRLVLPDVLVLTAAAWMLAAMIHRYGLASGFERGGSNAFDLSVGYFLARISFRSLTDMRRAFLLFLPGVLMVGLLIAAESISHRLIVQPLAEAVFGKAPLYAGGSIEEGRSIREVLRLGFLRARGPFSHSIHAGLFLSSLIGIYNLAGLRGWPRILANAVAPLSFFTVSSAAVISLVLGYALIAYDMIQRQVRELSWRILVYGGIFIMILLQVASKSGVPNLIARYLTFDAQTAFYRTSIWNWGMASIRSSPWFGIGYEDYDRPVWMTAGSVDSHWLLLAMRFGIVPSFALMLAVVMALFALGRASARVPAADQKFYRGIAISLFIMALAMFTVMLWGGVQMWFTILLGGCVACAQRSFRPLS